ncbi:MAG TPA: 3'-5' exonuclease [Burkholderiales bacterium]
MKWPWRRTPLAAVRWVVIDCEASGLDPARDRLLALGAVAVRDGRVEPAEFFRALLRQERPSEPGNILVHGIGGEAQLAGRPPDEALADLRAFVGEGVPVAFHAAFDAELLRRAMGRAAPGGWLDLAALAPALYPEHRACRALDEWLAVFGIAPLARHDALGDAFAAAQLLLVLLAAARRHGVETLEGLESAARDRHWLAPGG